MTQTKTSKRALLTSALSLLLCCTMLIGTTWAWFTDSVTSAGNKIQSGTLKVDMLVKGGNTGYNDYKSVKNDSNPVFNSNLWEPGYTLVTNVKVVNEGNLALKYTLKFVSGENIATAKLAEAIDVYYVASEVTVADRNTLAGVTPIDLKTVFEQGPDVVINDNLGAGEEDYATIVLKMRESAGNEYQGLTIPAFDICLLATQDTVENDSFNNQYDVDADGNPDNAGWPYQYTGTAVVTDTADPLNVTAGIATVTVPAAALTAGDRYELALDDVVKDETNAPEVALLFELKLKKNGVIINKETAGTEYTVSIQIGSGLAITSVKHDGTVIDDYTYDDANGTVTFKVKHFSPFEIKAMNCVTVENPADLATALADPSVKNIVLVTDTDYGTLTLDSTTNMEDVTIDANDAQMLMDIQSGATLKNVTIKNYSSTGATGTIDGSVTIRKGTDVDITFEDSEFKPGTGWAGVRTYEQSAKMKFVNCSFDGTGSKYSVYCSGGPWKSLEMYNCTFENFGKRVILLNGANTEDVTIIIDGCEFKNSTSDGILKALNPFVDGSTFKFTNNTLTNFTAKEGYFTTSNNSTTRPIDLTNATYDVDVSGNTKDGVAWIPEGLKTE